MNRIINAYLLIILTTLFTGCLKEETLLAPQLSTANVSAITGTSATSGGSIISDGGGAITAKGVCWSSTGSPTTADAKTNEGEGKGQFSSNLIDLTDGTTYRVRAYAINSAGTAYGAEVSFTTLGKPIVSTKPVSDITSSSAIGGGTIASDGGAAITAKGICWSAAINPTIADTKTSDGDGLAQFSSVLSGLTENTMYHVRAYATNSVGTSYGEDVLFTTLAKPSVTTKPVTAITLTAGTSGGNIVNDGGSPITSKGICWSTSPLPTVNDNKTEDGTGTDNYLSTLANLSPNTTYYVRAYAVNAVGTSYGVAVAFATYDVMDIEGNGYHSVTIGTQVWMVEDLKVTKYRNGDPIPNVTEGTAWGNLTSGAYCDYDNEASYSAIYGRIYNWYAVDDNRNIAPAGWHVATQAEWNTLVAFLGGNNVAGGKLKETGTTHWQSPNTGATNETGFTALPGGARGFQNVYSNLGIDNSWWTATANDATTAFGRYVTFSTSNCFAYSVGKESGSHVRCVKD